MTTVKGHDVGYVRVSSFSQNTDRQLDGIKIDKRYEDKASAKDIKRPELQKCLDFLREGDHLHVHSIDRLARNLIDLQAIVNDLIDRDVTVTFHKENLTFNGSNNSALNRLMLQMMGAFAEFERALIRERQREGIEKAKNKGTRFGRKPALSSDQINEIRLRIDAGETKYSLAKEFGVSRQTLYSSIKNHIPHE